MNHHRLTAYAQMLLVSLIWGAAGPVIKFTLADFPPLVFLAYRFAISSAVAFMVFGFSRPKFPSDRRSIGLILLYSVSAVTLGLGLLFFGFDKTTSLTGSLISALGPVMVVVAGALLLREHVTKIERLGIAVALAGTLVTIIGPLWHDGTNAGSISGNLLIVASLGVDTISALLVKAIVRNGTSPANLAHASFIIGFLTLFPVALVVHNTRFLTIIMQAPLSAHLGVWYMALLSGTLAYTLRNQADKTIEISETAVFSYLFPLWAAPLSVLWLGEKLTPQFVVGGTIIALGVGIAEYKKRKTRKI